MKKFGVRYESAVVLARCVNEHAARSGFFDVNRTQMELVAALGRKRTDGSVILTQDELESALYSAVSLDEEGGWPSDGPPLQSLIASVIPGSHKFEPYFCFILENKLYA